MYARGRDPPVSVMLRMNGPKSSDSAEYCTAPTRLTVPPSPTTAGKHPKLGSNLASPNSGYHDDRGSPS
jgi:hypothetical protein